MLPRLVCSSALALLLAVQSLTCEGFVTTRALPLPATTTTGLGRSFSVLARDDVDNVTWVDDEDDEDEVAPPKKTARWNKLNHRIKERIVKEGQERAIANKKKREPPQDKKRRKFRRGR